MFDVVETSVKQAGDLQDHCRTNAVFKADMCSKPELSLPTYYTLPGSWEPSGSETRDRAGTRR